jgi:deazaflavin-dependent oxidoreductase (nitroreductase family)
MALLDHPPRGLLRLAFRAPAWLYRAHLGWLLGERFLLLAHRGRKTGVMHQTVLECVGHDRELDAYYVVAAWARRAQWYRNILAEPRCGVRCGRRAFVAVARTITQQEAEDVLLAYQRAHPRAMREIGALFGFESPEQIARDVPVVELRPAMLRAEVARDRSA